MMTMHAQDGGRRMVPAVLLAAVVALLATGALAADGAVTSEGAADAPEAAIGEPARGSVTNLPLPRFVSLKVSEGNARRGPSLSHRIDWVFVRRGMPLEVTGEYGHWRRVRDLEGAGGWVHYSLLSGVRSVVVTEQMADLRMRPDSGAPVVARAEAGVVARLGECGLDWCRISASGHDGWIEKARLWGVAPEEVSE